MNSLLQRLAGQARGVSGPRVRSAAAVHAQVPIALPSRAQQEAAHSAPVSAATVASLPATSRDHAAHPAPETADAAAGPPIREAEQSLRIGEDMTLPIAVDAGPASITPVTVQPAPAPLVDHLPAPARSASGSIRPAMPERVKVSTDREPSEVHVHIGRIEVTALPAPAAPKPRERPARQHVPLSDYLAKGRSS